MKRHTETVAFGNSKNLSAYKRKKHTILSPKEFFEIAMTGKKICIFKLFINLIILLTKIRPKQVNKKTRI